MRGFKSIFVSSKHKINCFLIQEKYFQTANAVDTLPLTVTKPFFKFSSFGSALEALRHLIQRSELVSARFKLVYALIFIALLGG